MTIFLFSFYLFIYLVAVSKAIRVTSRVNEMVHHLPISVILIRQIAAWCVRQRVSGVSGTSPFGSYHFSSKITDRHLESGLDQ